MGAGCSLSNRPVSHACSAVPTTVGYITDVEGNWEYFLRCLAVSCVLQWRDSTESELILKDGCFFVYGGDVGDKRDGTIRFAKLMVQLKQRYPDRVFLLVGNRDLNKLRFLSELTEQDLRSCLPPLPPGVTGSGKDCRQYLKELAVKQGLAQHHDGVTESQIMEMNTMESRLRWILDCTMGSLGDFEFRRQELAILSSKQSNDIDDAAVVASFYGSVSDSDGFMRQYLQLGQLAVVIDCTLYVHGGVYGLFDKKKGVESCLGLVPIQNDLGNQSFCGNLHEWVLQLNNWFSSQVSASIMNPGYNSDRSTRAAQTLFLYGSYVVHPSVIMARMLDDSSMPLPVPLGIALKLKEWGICRVVCGHTPHGNAPTVFTSHGIQIVMADTSFSDMSSKERPTDNRGVAVSEVLICGPVLYVHGALHDGVLIDFVTVTGRDQYHPSTHVFDRSSQSFTFLERVKGDEYIGQLTKDGYFVKSATADNRYSLCKVSGFKYEYKYVSLDDLLSLL